MATEGKTIIIKLDFDVNDFTKAAVKLNGEIATLNKQQAELKKQNKEGTVEFQKNKEKLASLGTELRKTNKAISDITTANKANAGSNEQLRAQLSVLTLQYNKMDSAMRDTSNEGKALRTQISTISETLKANESAIGDNRRNVGNYSGAIKELKDELKEARGELLLVKEQFGENSQQYIEAAKRAGELNDKLDDINQTIKASTGEAIERLGGDLSLLKDKILSLDFGGISTQLNSLASTVKGISFKSLIQGTEGVGASLKNLATSILSNPIFILAVTIAGVTKAAYDMINAFILVDKQTNTVTESIENQRKALEEYGNRASEAYIRINESLGVYSKNQAELKRQDLKDNQELLEAKRKYGEDLFKLGQELQLNLTGLEKGRFDETYKGDFDELQRKKRFNLEKAKLDAAYKIEFINLTKTQLLERRAAEVEDNVERGKIANDAIKENAKKRQEDLKNQLSEQQAQLDKYRQLVIDNIGDDFEKQRQQAKFNYELEQRDAKGNFLILIELKKKYEAEINKINNAEANKRQEDLDKEVQRQIDSDKARIDAAQKNEDEMDRLLSEGISNKLDQVIEKNAKEEELEKEHQKKIIGIQQEAAAATTQIVGNIAQIKNNAYQEEINASERSTNDQIANLQRQLDLGIISQAQFEAQSNEIKDKARREEAELKKKQFRLNKRAAEINIGIKTAEAIITAYTGDPYTANALAIIAGIVGATELAVVESTPEPEFAKGGKVLSGKKITSSDGKSIHRANGDNLLASVKTNEVILNESQQRMLGGANTFKAIGVPGFASGGLTGVPDGGLFAKSISNPTENRIAAQNQARIIAESLPPPVVIVQDINEAQGTLVSVESKANI